MKPADTRTLTELLEALDRTRMCSIDYEDLHGEQVRVGLDLDRAGQLFAAARREFLVTGAEMKAAHGRATLDAPETLAAMGHKVTAAAAAAVAQANVAYLYAVAAHAQADQNKATAESLCKSISVKAQMLVGLAADQRQEHRTL